MKTPKLSGRARAAALIAAILAVSYVAGYLYLYGLPGAPAQAPVVKTGAPRYTTVPESGGKEAPASAPPQTPAGGEAGETGGLEIPERKISYTAQVSIRAEDVVAAARRVEEVAASMGGYVSWESITSGEKPRAVVTIKVPVERYRDAIEELKGIGDLVSLSQRALDVTNTYVDLEARLRNLKAEEQRLLDLLGRAKSVGEIIQVEDRLARVRTQIEYLEAMLRNLNRRIEYATITVTVTPPGKAAPLGLDFGRVLQDSVKLAFTVVAGIIMLTVGLSPIWVPAAALYLYYRRRGGKAGGAKGQPGE